MICQVLARPGHGRFRVLLTQRIEHMAMGFEQANPGLRQARRNGRITRQHEQADRRARQQQGLVLRSFGHQCLKFDGRLHRRLALLHQRLGVRQVLLQALQLFAGDALGRQSGAQRLQRGSHLPHFAKSDLLQAERPPGRAGQVLRLGQFHHQLFAHALAQALLLQLTQGLAHRRAVHAVVGRELGLDRQSVTRPDLATHNALAQVIADDAGGRN